LVLGFRFQGSSQLISLTRCFLVFFALISSPLFACSSLEYTTDEQNFQKANEVFIARIVGTDEKTFHNERFVNGIPVVEGRYHLVETLKGHPSQDGIVRDFVYSKGNCSLGLLTGITYLFFISDDSRLVLTPDGSRGIINMDAEPIRQTLTKLRELSKNIK
jgi:hypothetical protein